MVRCDSTISTMENQKIKIKKQRDAEQSENLTLLQSEGDVVKKLQLVPLNEFMAFLHYVSYR